MNWFQKWSALNPLARHALAALTGIMLVDWGFIPSQKYPLLAAAIVFWIAAHRFPRFIPVEIGFLFAFAYFQSARLDATRDHPLRAELLDRKRSAVLVTGHMIPVPDVDNNPGSARPFTITAKRVEFTEIGRVIEREARIRAWVPREVEVPCSGDYRIHGTLSAPSPPMNPGQFDGAYMLMRLGIIAEIRVTSIELVERDRLPVRATLVNAAAASREWISRQVGTGIEDDEDALTLIRAMALGTTDDSDPELERPFRNTGTLHIFAVSGLHVALLGMIGRWTFRHLRVPRRLSILLLIFIVFAYAFITGWRPSAARAAIMIALVLAAELIDRQTQLQNSIGLAALVLFVFDSQNLFLPGFQLSFAVLWAIAIMAGPLQNLMHPWVRIDPFIPWNVATNAQKRWSNAKHWFAESISVSAAAWIGSLPFMLWHFHLITPVGIIANCILVPLSSGILIVVCVTLILGAGQLAFAQVIVNHIGWLLAKLMFISAAFFQSIPGAYFSWNPRLPELPGKTEFTVLHLPFGESAQHLRLGEKHWLFDCGNKKSFNRIVEPFLAFHGYDHLDGVVLSHSDIDHIGGAERAFRHYRAPLGFHSVLEPWKNETGASAMKTLLAQNQKRKLFAPRALTAGDIITLGDQAAATVLYPQSDDLHDKGNDRSLILRLDIRGHRILWINDAGFEAEKALLERYLPRDLRSQVLIRNQNNADFSALAEFLAAVRPRILITSNVTNSPEEKTPPSIGAYTRRHRATLFDLSRDGAVTLHIDDTALRATAFYSHRAATVKRPK